MQLPFIKMQGLGNDFIVLDHRQEGARSELVRSITPDLARRICDRRFGIGADQILWLKSPGDRSADARMEILNADGSTAEMCGNGIRAVALYVHQHPLPGQSARSEYRVETLAGIKTVRVRGDQVSVDMGAPKLGGGFPKSGEPLHILGKEIRFFEVSMGNPHAVVFVDDIHLLPFGHSIEELGPAIENHLRFPKRTNVEFVQVSGPSSILVRVWERGAGVTLACGTGACASAVAALATHRVQGPVGVQLPGGKLTIDWGGDEQPVIMEGPAQEVFSGRYPIAG
jgi:diaminopimelate epimerase